DRGGRAARRPSGARPSAIALDEDRVTPETDAVEEEGADHQERAETVDDAAREPDRRRFRHVADRYRDLADLESGVDRRHQELGIEDEVVREPRPRQPLEDLATVSAQPGMEIREVLPEQQVLDEREQAVAEIL